MHYGREFGRHADVFFRAMGPTMRTIAMSAAPALANAGMPQAVAAAACGMPALASAGAALMATVRVVGPIALKKRSAWRPNSRP